MQTLGHTAINPFFMDVLLNASTTCHIQITRPIFNIKGVELATQGTQLSPELHALLINEKLRDPVESYFQIDEQQLKVRLTNSCNQLLDENRILANFLSWQAGGLHNLKLLESLNLPPAANLQLLLLDSLNASNLRHNVLMAMVCAGFAHFCQQPNHVVTEIFYAGLLHDIGMLYINPQFCTKQSDMSPEEWQHICSHPIIGQTLITDVLGLSQNIGRYVGEHHERYNGTGYPKRLASVQLSLGGQILALVERVAPLLEAKQDMFDKIHVALKVQPRENRFDLVSIFLNRLINPIHHNTKAIESLEDEEVQRNMHDTFATIANILSVCDHLKHNTEFHDPKQLKVLTLAMQRIDDIQRAFSSAGLDMVSHQIGLVDDETRIYHYYEASLILDELNYRFKELARDLTLYLSEISETDAQIFTPLLAALDSKLNRSLDLSLEQQVELF